MDNQTRNFEIYIGGDEDLIYLKILEIVIFTWSNILTKFVFPTNMTIHATIIHAVDTDILLKEQRTVSPSGCRSNHAPGSNWKMHSHIMGLNPMTILISETNNAAVNSSSTACAVTSGWSRANILRRQTGWTARSTETGAWQIVETHSLQHT